MDKIEIEDEIEKIVTADDAKCSKPFPEYVETAVKILNVAPAEAILIGNTP